MFMTESELAQEEAKRKIGYGPIWLRKSGDRILVEIEYNGKWYTVIRESDGNFSHCVEPLGIENCIERCELSDTLNS